MPEGARIIVGMDSRCVAGETVLAITDDVELPRQYRKS